MRFPRRHSRRRVARIIELGSQDSAFRNSKFAGHRQPPNGSAILIRLPCRAVACLGSRTGINARMMRILFRLLPCLAIVFAAGCSTFDQRFAAASKTPAKNGQSVRAYAGRWTSASHPGSGGNLRCILSQVSASDFRADFHATWHGFASEHTVVLQTKSAAHGKSGVRDFEGTSRLRTPIGAGTYSCKGTVDFRAMRAAYDATYDRGTFELSRVASRDAER